MNILLNNTKDAEDTEYAEDTESYFAENTMILTKEGFVEIKNIKIGDEVLNESGEYSKIANIHTKEQKGIYEFRVMGSPINKVTGDTLVKVIKKEMKFNSKLRKTERVFNKIQWVKAKELNSKTDLVMLPNIVLEDNPLDITIEEAYLLGRYVADGYIRNNKRPGRKNSYNAQVIFAVGKDKLQNFLEKVTTYNVGYSEERTAYKCRIIGQRLKNLCLLFGRGAQNKKVHSDILRSNKEIQKAFLEGYWSGDGHINKKGHYSASTVSKELAYGLSYLIYNVYEIVSSMSFVKTADTAIIEGRVINQLDKWALSFRKYVNRRTFIIKDDIVWSPVREVQYDADKIETMYQIILEDGSNFTANKILFKNY